MHSLAHTMKHEVTVKHHEAPSDMAPRLSERLALMGWLAACVAVPMWLALRF
jgi:hypothetical protein